MQFQYENYLFKIKKYVRKSQNPIAQIAKPMKETETFPSWQIRKKLHITISTKKKDSCFLLKNGKFAFVREKKQTNSFCVMCLDKQPWKTYWKVHAVQCLWFYQNYKIGIDQQDGYTLTMTTLRGKSRLSSRWEKLCYGTPASWDGKMVIKAVRTYIFDW